MTERGRPSSPRLFLILGIVLIVAAIIVFPARIPLHDQQADENYYGVGWLFAPILGVWGLSGVILGLVHSSISKRKIESYLMPLLVIVCAGLAYAAYMVLMFGTGIVASAGRDEPFWWVYFLLMLTPNVITLAVAAMFYGAKSKLDETFKKRNVKVSLFAAVLASPVAYSVALTIFLRLI